MRSIRKHNIANDIFVVGDGVEALDYLYYREKYKDSNHTAPHLNTAGFKASQNEWS
jgi:hypothetical protein